MSPWATSSGNGSTDLVVFMIDAPAGAERGVSTGSVAGSSTESVTGGWGPWQPVPDWPFWENAGGGIALADLDGSGSLDLVPVRRRRAGGAEHRPGPGRPRARRRRAPTGGWGPWQTVPDWPFWENQGADCAVADVDGDGSLELVLLVVDNPGGQNAGLYRTAALGPDGTASGWSPWASVPDWFGWENAGAGLAVGDLDGDGTPELLVLAVDSAVGQERCLLQRRLAPGRPRPPRRRVGPVAEGARMGLRREPGWRGRPRRPRRRRPRPRRARRGQPGRAERRAWSVSCRWRRDLATAAEEGVWRILEMDSEVLAVHAALLPTGDALFFAGSSNNPDAATAKVYGTRVWHYPAPAMSAPDDAGRPVLLRPRAPARRAPVAAGGTERYDPFVGLKQGVVFDPAAGPPSPASPTGRAGAGPPSRPMGQGRWYPTLVALPDGDVLAAASSASPRARCGSRDGESPRPFRRGSPGRNAPSLRRGGPRPPGRGRQPS